jgi:hypothetical protein
LGIVVVEVLKELPEFAFLHRLSPRKRNRWIMQQKKRAEKEAAHKRIQRNPVRDKDDRRLAVLLKASASKHI